MLCFWVWGFHAKPVFFCIISGDLLFDALIIGACQICLILGQTLIEGIISKLFVGVLMEMWEVLGASEQPGQEVYLGGLGEKEFMYGALSQLLYLWDLEEPRGGEGWSFYIHHMGCKPKRGETNFTGGDDPSSYQDLLDYNKLNNLINFYILTQNIISAI